MMKTNCPAPVAPIVKQIHTLTDHFINGKLEYTQISMI